MPRIDPQQLLACLTPLLAVNGGIKSSGEVIRLANLMEKYSKKLVSKCIYIQILKCTETDLLGQFMAAGGWNLVYTWLNDGVNSSNWPFVNEILEMLLLCPVDGNRLKSNNTPKIIKSLSLNITQNAYITALSKKLVEQWLKIAHQEKQSLQQQQQKNGLNGTAIINNVSQEDKNLLNENDSLIKSETDLNTPSIPENIHVNSNNNNNVAVVNGTADDSPKKSSENVKYKVSQKDSGESGLVLSLKRSTSPNTEVDSKIIKSPDSKVKSEHKSKSSSSSSSEKDRSKKSSSSSSSSHKSSSSKSSHRDKDRSSSHKSSSSSSSSSKDKDRHRDSSKSSSKHSSSSSRDKEKDREKRKRELEKEQAEKDKETLSFLTPLPSNKLQRIPKRQHSESENKSDTENSAKSAKTNEVVEKKKPSISIEVRKGDKPKTVKTVPSQFRNHGLAEEPPPPPSRKVIKKPAPTTPVILPTPTYSSSKSISPPPAKKLHLDKAFEPDVPERAGGVKLIKPKPMLIESASLFDAIEESNLQNKKLVRKRKRLPSGSSAAGTQAKKEEPESPKIEAKPLKFYKDTLDENADEEKTTNGTASPTKDIDNDATNSGADEKTVKDEESKSEESSEKSKSDEQTESKDDEPIEKRPPGAGTGPDGPPGIISDPNFPRRKRAKRPLRWRPDEELIDVRYFELDENERVNVTKTFNEQKQDEHTRERMMMRSKVTEYYEWHKPKLIDNVPDIPYGSKSLEAAVQAERERNTLQEMFFNNRSMYDSPHEPDPEDYDVLEPQIIPLEDVTGNPDSVTNFKDVQWPAPKGDQPQYISQGGFGNLFGSLGSSLTIPPAPVNPALNPLVGFNLQAAIPQDPSALNFMNAAIIQQNLQPFIQPPPLIQNNYQSNMNYQNRGSNSGSSNNYSNNNYNHNNKYDSNNRNRMGSGNSGGGSNWVRGNANLRRGMCHQYQRNGYCRNQKTGCPYIHER